MSKTDVENLQAIQRHLKRKGLNLSQQVLLGKIVDYISKNELDFIETITERKKGSDDDALDEWMDNQVDGESTDVVNEHDEVN